MTQYASLFRNGQSQAVRLPKEFRFEGEKVLIRRVGNAVLLLPADQPWQLFGESLEMFSDDFMNDREQPAQDDREIPFA
jgi:antitoxin VapB